MTLAAEYILQLEKERIKQLQEGLLTRQETRGNRQYFREERLQTGTGRAQKGIVHRRPEGLYQNLYRRCSQAHPITYEYEVHGRAASPHPLYACTPLFHCPKGQNTHHRPRPHRIR